MQRNDESRQLASVRQALLEEFLERVPQALVDERFTALVDHFSTAPVRSFVPVLVHRQAREHLRHALR